MKRRVSDSLGDWDPGDPSAVPEWPPQAAPKPASHLREALGETANTVGLALAGAAALVTANPVPLVLGAAAEALYLLFVPDSRPYRLWVDQRYRQLARDEREKVKERLLLELAPRDHERWLNLQALRDRLQATVDAQDESTRSLLSGEVAKLDYLQDAFLGFLATKERYSRYLPPNARELLQERLDDAAACEEREEDEGVRKVLQQNVSLLKERLDAVDRIERNRRMLDAQMDSMENTFALTLDRIVSLRPPSEIASQLETVITGVETTENLIRETAPVLEQIREAEFQSRG
ncbi:MAG TPA: hypothetical protein VGN26_08350 [Armatimonadota bacterium]